MKAKSFPLILIASSLLFQGCANKNDQMEAQIMQHDAQLRQLQPVQADSYNQVQSLRQELDDLKGQIADIRNAGGASAMVEKLKRHEQALHQIETSMAMNFNLGTPIAAGSGAVAGGLASSAGQTHEQTASLTQATAQAAQPAPNPGVQTATAGGAAAAPGTETWGQETPKPKAPVAQKDMTVALYEAGVNSFNSRNYGEAQRSFSDFIKNFGSDAKVPSAQYYLAECYFQKNQFSDAALAYDAVITKYPSSPKAPAAYLKQGICFSKMQQSKAASARMQELIKKYPSSPEATRAKSFLKNNK